MVAGNAREFGDARAPRGLLGRQEAGEEELIGRQAGNRQRRQQRRGAGQRRHRVARLLRGAHELESGIGDKRRAGIGDERNGGAFGQPAQQRRPGLRGIVVVIGRERGFNPIAIEQLTGDAGVLAGDQVGAGQRGQARAA